MKGSDFIKIYKNKIILVFCTFLIVFNFIKPIKSSAVIGVDDAIVFTAVMTLLVGTYTFSTDADLMAQTEQIVNDMTDDMKLSIQQAYTSGKDTFKLTKDTFVSFLDTTKKSISDLTGKKVYSKSGFASIDLERSSILDYQFCLEQYKKDLPYTLGSNTIGVKPAYADILQLTFNKEDCIYYKHYNFNNSKFEFKDNMNVILKKGNDYIFVPFLDYKTGKSGYGLFKKNTFGYRLSSYLLEIEKNNETKEDVIGIPKNKINEDKLSKSKNISIHKGKNADDVVILNENGVLNNNSSEKGVLDKIYNLFIPEPNYIAGQFGAIKLTMENKYTNSLEILNELKELDAEEFDDITVNVGALLSHKPYDDDGDDEDGNNDGIHGFNVTIVSSGYVNRYIDYIRKATSCFWVFLLIVYLYNQIYFLIRGTYPITAGSSVFIKR